MVVFSEREMRARRGLVQDQLRGLDHRRSLRTL